MSKKDGKRIVTRSGRVLKVNRSLGQRFMAMREAKTLRKLSRLRGLPKSRLKRVFWRLHPKRVAEFWFSRDGAVSALKITGITILFLFVFTLGVFAYYRKFLPDIANFQTKLGGSISYYDRTGSQLLWQDYDAIKRVPVQSQDISKYIKDATVAVEDRDFYNHRGFDVRGITRAAVNDIFRRSATQGGSTITQQLVKLSLDWTQERTVARKVKELILAVELERTYTKDDILTGYLNAAPYGSINYGVQVAAADYFHKSAKDLTLPEAAMMAAIPKSPALYSPYSGEYFNRDAFLDRYNYVLDSMVQIGRISKKEAEDAKKVDVLAQVQPQTNNKYAGIQAPYFVLAAKNELITKWVPRGPGAGRIGGWKVITTLDKDLQSLADQQVQKGLTQVKRQGGDVAALVAEDVKTGQVAALVGGSDFNNPDYGKINYAQWPISPGSSFKPYDYVSLIENGNNVGAGSVLYDVQQPLPGYPCTNKAKPKQGGNCLENFDFRNPGPLSVRYALGGSRNVPAVKAILTAGVDKTRKTAKEMMGPDGYGYNCFADQALTQPAQCYGASGIGDGAYLHLDEHTHGFATISRNGLHVPQTYILKINDSAGKKIYEWKQPKEGDKYVKQAVRPETAYIVGNILSDPNASYFSQKIHRYKGWKFGLKTGTTNDAKDGLLMGFSSKYAVGVWVGYHTRQKTMSGFMENMTRPIWNGFMTGAHANLQPEDWTAPRGIQTLPAFVVRTHVGIGSVEPSPTTDIYPSWYKPRAASSQSTTIDKVSGKLATNCTPSLAKQTLSGSSAPNTFSADIFYPPGAGATSTTSNTTGASDDVHSCSDSQPSINLTVTDNGNGTYTFTAFVQAGTHPFNSSQYSQYPGTVNFLVNGQQVGSRSITDPSDTVSMTYTPTSSGSAKVAAQVIDSVLYDTTSEATVNFTVGTTSPPTITSAVAAGSTTTISWTGGNPNYTVYKSDGSQVAGTSCTNTGSNSCTANQSLSGTQIYVQDGNSVKSANYTVP